jgi:nucleoside-diphosphate-sugar epimerase
LSRGSHDYIFIDDFVDAVVSIAEYNEEHAFNIVNIGSGTQVSNEDFIRSVQKVVGRPIPVQLGDNHKVYDSDCWVCDTKTLQTKYGFVPKFSLEDGLKRTFIMRE